MPPHLRRGAVEIHHYSVAAYHHRSAHRQRRVRIAIIVDRIFRFPLTGSRVRNYDGAGSKFGDTSVDATTTNNANSSVYASVDANNPNRMTVVAINRTNQPLNAAIAIADDNRFTQAQVETAVEPLRQRIADLEAQLAAARDRKDP